MINAKEARTITENFIPVLMENIETDIRRAAMRGENMTYIGCFEGMTEDFKSKIIKTLEENSYTVTNNCVSW